MSKINRQLGLVTLGLAFGFWLAAGTAVAQTPAHEPFKYTAGSAINGLNGGTGWAGGWSGAGTNVVAPGLTYPGLTPTPTGNALGPTSGPASFRSITPIVGTAGTSVVISALIRSHVNGTPATQATLGNVSGGTFIFGDLPQANAAAGNWGFQTAAGSFYSGVPVQANVTTYLVAQIDFNVSGTNDRVRLWVNPPVNGWYTVNPSVESSAANIPQINGIFWQSQQGLAYPQGPVVDEIRVSSSKTACVQPPNTTMVAWYPFDEPSGPIALELAAANDGQKFNGPAPVTGMVFRALRFDGVNDYVESPSSIVTNFGPASTAATGSGGWSTSQGDFSIDAWIRIAPSVPSSQLMIIVDKRLGTPPSITGYSFFVYNDQIWLQLADGQGSGFSNYPSSPLAPLLNDGNWHHVAVTVKRTTSTGIVFYHNGQAAGTGNPQGRAGSLVNTSPLRVGTRTATTPLSAWFQGDIDELEIFNRVLTPTELKSIYTAGPFGKCK